MKQLYLRLFMTSLLLVTFNSCKSPNSIESVGGYIQNQKLFFSTYKTSYSTNVDTSQAGLYTANLDGSERKLLYANATIYSSPRNGVILFSRPENDSITFFLGDDALMTERRLFSVYGMIDYAILSPDGKKMIYANYSSDNGQVRIFDIASHTWYDVTGKGQYYYRCSPVFSDDSKKILFAADNRLYSMSIDGFNRVQIGSNASVMSNGFGGQLFDWSPLGDYVCYSSFPDYQSPNEELDIFSLAHGDYAVSLPNGVVIKKMKWSAMGNYVAFSFQQPDQALYDGLGIYNVVTGKINLFPVPYTHQSGYIDAIDWSQDEQLLFVQTYGWEVDKFVQNAFYTLLEMQVKDGFFSSGLDFDSTGIRDVSLGKAIGDH